MECRRDDLRGACGCRFRNSSSQRDRSEFRTWLSSDFQEFSYELLKAARWVLRTRCTGRPSIACFEWKKMWVLRIFDKRKNSRAAFFALELPGVHSDKDSSIEIDAKAQQRLDVPSITICNSFDASQQDSQGKLVTSFRPQRHRSVLHNTWS